VPRRGRLIARLGAAVLAYMTAMSVGSAETTFVAPPRTISDITALLDQQKPDPEQIKALQAAAAASPPANTEPRALARFYYERAQARAGLGQNRAAIADTERALALIEDKASRQGFLAQLFLVNQLRPDSRRSLRLLRDMEALFRERGAPDELLTIYRNMNHHLVSLGDLDGADAVLAKAVAVFERGLADSARAEAYRSAWEANLENIRAELFRARGQYADAEAALAKAERLWRDAWVRSERWPNRPPLALWQQVIDGTIADAAEVRAVQGRLAEAEADARRTLLNRLRGVGKYHMTTGFFLRRLASVLLQQGRYAEAEKLQRVAIDVYRELGFADSAQLYVRTRTELAETLGIEGRWAESASMFDAVDRAVQDWPPAARARLQLRRSRVQALYHSGNVEAGLAAARALLAYERARVGEQHTDFAMARALVALGLARMGREAEALSEFRAAVPTLAGAKHAEEDEPGVAATRHEHQLREVIEPYLALLAREELRAPGATAAESFALADAIRGRSVQSAVAAASARMAARDPVLATLVRKEQDLRKQVGALFGLLNDLLGQPPEARDERTLGDLRARITALRSEHTRSRAEIATRFPDYADLIDPAPATIADLQRALRPGETVLSFYFGREHSFVWAVPRSGAPSFAAIKASAGEIEEKIKILRKALEPNAQTVGDIPAFDLKLAHELYALLLKPVEPGWKEAKSLIVVTNGALGLLPLSLLPTAPAAAPSEGEPLFAGYRAVPWLARTHAVSAVPSAAALRTLRQLPAGSPQRERLIGFGDPFFNAEQAAEGERPKTSDVAGATTTRGLPLRLRSAPQTQSVDSAELGLLPRLPDTADELRAIASALASDPAKVLFLGKSANEASVKAADLSRFRIVAFATHGLVPGDLNGLTQPALALSAPAVAGVAGDGLLTMEEILALKLDADWVVLSACNTASGAEAGAEAASGLGRAFFYAGTRAILVTNWSVHSASARELVTDLFRRQAADPTLSRAEALRQAMLALLDKGGYADSAGKLQFAYAHPLFWAPYTIIGDAGAR
jgi:CHAT domain-containing protein